VDYGVDSVGGRTGLLTVRKRAGDLPLQDLLQDALGKALGAIQAIETDGSAKVRFTTGCVEIQILDRLFARNDDAGRQTVEADVEWAAGRLFGDAKLVRVGTDDARKPLTFEATALEAADVATLLGRLGGDTTVPAATTPVPPAMPAATVPAPPAVPGQSPWDVSVEQLKHLRDQGFDHVLIDVREEHEYDICQIGGTLIPLGQLGERMHEIDRGAHIVVHCHLGGRSAMAVRSLRDAGFENAWNLQGGIRAWIQRIDDSLNDY
jgi:rhodanese-related sulfurtransferase